jgi:hypothetical protein
MELSALVTDEMVVAPAKDIVSLQDPTVWFHDPGFAVLVISASFYTISSVYKLDVVIHNTGDSLTHLGNFGGSIYQVHSTVKVRFSSGYE